MRISALLTRQFDSLGRLEQEINNLGTFGYGYLNETQLPELLTYPDGHSTHIDYKPVNEDRRLERIEHRFANSSILAAHEYGHDDEGTITTWEQERSGLNTRTWHFGYDDATRLTSATLKNPAEAILKTHGWQYDPGNNRIASKTDAGGLIPSQHNKLNQLLNHGRGPIRFSGTLDEPGTVKVAGLEAKMRHHTLFEAYLDLDPGTHEIEIEATDFSENTTTQSFEVEVANEPETVLEYDLNGNLTTRTNDSGTTTYEWDALDRLITIIYPDTSRSEFTYDGLSRRVRIIEKNGSSTITSDKCHLWDDLRIAEERATDSSIVNKRFYPQGVELVTGPDAGVYTYRTDHLGSTREVVDDTGDLIARYDYSAWGETELVSGSFDLDFRYTGHYYHQPSDLHLAPFRAYDSGLGRWLSADPIGETGGINLYGYVEGDPINGWDPLGLATAVCIGGATDGNPFGHTAIAFTGQGVFTFGTGAKHPLGSSFTDYLKAQAKYRDTSIYILPTSPAQEKAIADHLRKLKGKPLPNAKTNPGDAMKDNCNTRTMDGLNSAGIPMDRSAFPAELQRQLEDLMKATGRGFSLPFGRGNNNADAWGAFNPNP